MYSRILDTPEARTVRLNMATNTNLKYHNYTHVLSMYDYLEKTEEPYTPELDYAVLLHDAVYDDKPHKEKRSADLAVSVLNNVNAYRTNIVDVDVVYDMIMATATHSVTHEDESAIVRADLHQLASPEHTITNYVLLMQEAKSLYYSTASQAAEGTILFMQGLYDRVHYNAVITDVTHSEFYEKVLEGILSTIIYAKRVAKQ